MAKGLGGFFSDLMGSSTDQRFYAPQRSRDDYSYGGSAQRAEQLAAGAEQAGMQAQHRTGATADYRKAQADRELDWRSRGNQTEALQMLRAQATGQAPSIAQMSADRSMQQAAAEQASAAASARGPAAMALAQQNAAANTASVQSQVARDAAIASAQERLAAQQAYFGGSGQVRQLDQSRQAMAAQQAQFNTQMENAQRQRNDAFQLANMGRADQMRGMQMQGQMGYAGASAEDQWRQQGMTYGQARDNAQAAGDAFGGLMSGAGGIAALAASDVRTKQNINDPNGFMDPEQRQAARDAGINITPAIHNTAMGKALPPEAFGYTSATAPEAVTGAPNPMLEYMQKRDAKAQADAAEAKKQAGIAGIFQGFSHMSDMNAKMGVVPAGTPAGAAMDAGSIYGLAGLLSDKGAKSVDSDPMSEALRSLEGSQYEYKPAFTPPEQVPGEKNVGPMAQTMAADPIAGTAVKEREDGMLAIDGTKALKLSMAGLAHLQKQLDELKAKKGK